MRALEDGEPIDAEDAVVAAGARGDSVDLIEAEERLRYLLRLRELLRGLLGLPGGAAVLQEETAFFVLEMNVDQAPVV